MSGDDTSTIELATELTVAWLSNANTRVRAEDVPAFLSSMHQAVAGLSAPAAPDQSDAAAAAEAVEHKPTVSVRKSLASADHIISMIDGKPYKTLRRHLRGHGLTPDDYRQRYGLKADYPIVAATYSEARRAMAKTIGLGRKAGQKVKQAVEDVAEEVAAPLQRAGRKTAAAAKHAAQEHLGGGNHA